MNKGISIITSIAAFAILMYASSCQEECGEPDVDGINSLYLQFNMDGSAGAFDAEDLDSVFVVRFSEAAFDTFNFPVDTLNLFQTSSFGSEGRIVIGRETPIFPTPGPPYYTEYKYLFQSYGDDWQVRLQSIHLEGRYTDDEMCDYINLSKTYFLNDDSIDASSSTQYVIMNKD